tara:strand:+ start:5779 stop:6195 length:417 start_codon:yes stop_codon:yes gene_type:complete
MFKSLQTIISPSSRAGGYMRETDTNAASTTFYQTDRTPCIDVEFVVNGERGNGYVANLYKISATKYRFRLYAPDGTRLNTVTQEDATPPSTVIAQLVDLINANATFSTYVQVTFRNESTEAFSSSVDIGDGQTLDGGN